MDDSGITFKAQTLAAAKWNDIAEEHEIESAIGGIFTAQLFTEEFSGPAITTDPPELEVYYNASSKRAIENAVKPFGDITHCVLTVDNGKGVPVGFRQLKDPLLGPMGSPQNTFGGKPNFFHHRLGFQQGETIVPTLLPQVSLKLILERVLKDNDPHHQPPTRRIFNAIDSLMISGSKICHDWTGRDPGVFQLLHDFFELYSDKFPLRPPVLKYYGFTQSRFRLQYPTPSLSLQGLPIPPNPPYIGIPASDFNSSPPGPQLPTPPLNPSFADLNLTPRDTSPFFKSGFGESAPTHSVRDNSQRGIVYVNNKHPKLSRAIAPKVSLFETAHEILTAVELFIGAALRAGIKCEFTGLVAGWLLGMDVPVYGVQVFLSNEDRKKFQVFAIKFYDEGLLRVTERGHHIVVINKSSFIGVPLMFSKRPDGMQISTISLNRKLRHSDCTVSVPKLSDFREWADDEYYRAARHPVPYYTSNLMDERMSYIYGLSSLIQQLYLREYEEKYSATLPLGASSNSKEHTEGISN
jgi:hypothetical protein